jgi:hypothetical protein
MVTHSSVKTKSTPSIYLNGVNFLKKPHPCFKNFERSAIFLYEKADFLYVHSNDKEIGFRLFNSVNGLHAAQNNYYIAISTNEF